MSDKKNALPTGTVLYDQDGDCISMVIAEDATDVAAALVAMVAETFGGEPFPVDNPAIVAALPYARIEWWHSCTKAWREAEGVYDYDSYWSRHGDGKREVHVVTYEDSAYQLGESAEESLAAAPSLGGQP